jgi:hypothetical protein
VVRAASRCTGAIVEPVVGGTCQRDNTLADGEHAAGWAACLDRLAAYA